jgi:hypothetical protein
LVIPGLVRADHDNYCIAVANPARHVTVMTRIAKWDFNPATNETTIGGNTGTEKTDSIAFQVGTGVLYGTNVLMAGRPENERSGYLGTYNMSTAKFNQFANPVGYGTGISGTQNIYDFSGLTFDSSNGYLYASHVRTTNGHADLLVRIDPTTGQLVKNAFGTARDYALLPILPAYPGLQWIDDIAIDPSDGQMYGIINNSTVGDRLIKINKNTGATSDVGQFGIGEVEGMDFDPHGRLWVTAAVVDDGLDWWLYEVDKNTGRATNPRRISNSTNYEALACMTGPYAGPPVTTTPTGTQPPTLTPTVTARAPDTPNTPQPPVSIETIFLPIVNR